MSPILVSWLKKIFVCIVRILFKQNCLLFSNLLEVNGLCIKIPEDANNQSECLNNKYFVTFKIMIL